MNTSDAIATLRRTPTLESLGPLEAPDRADLVGQFLLDSAASGRSVVPVGGGGALALGNPSTVDAIGLSTRKLNQIIDYQPTDLTLSVGAGATLAEIQAVIGAKGQALPIETVDPATATIGGLLATALSGPRRYGGGTLRDVLIGIAVAYPDGTVGKGGGLVVKNVSGYDVMRMHYGALGTLGVIVSANFKVLPTIRDEFTATWQVDSIAEVRALIESLRAPEIRPTALTCRTFQGGWIVSARYEGRPGGLAAVVERIEQQFGNREIVRNEESTGAWRGAMLRRALVPEVVRIRIGSLPTETVEVGAAAQDVLREVGAEIELEPGVGLCYASWTHSDDQRSKIAIENLRLANPGRAITIMSAPDSVKSGADVWGDEPESIGIMRRLKDEFDPGGVLNRHRFAGHI